MKTKLFLTVALVLLLIISITSCSKIANDQAGMSDSESQPTVDFNDVQAEPATEPSSEVDEQTTISETEVDTEEIQNEMANDLSDSIIDQKYLGVWYADIYHEDDIMIYEITSDSIKFSSGVFRHFGFDGVAVKCDNGEFRFGYDTQDSPYYPGMTGRLIFDEGGITLIYDSFGVFDDDYSYLEKEYHFTMKDKNSDHYVDLKNARRNHQYDEVDRLSKIVLD